MIKKTMTFLDYNGLERTEDFYFHLSKAELVELELGTEGGLAESLQTLIKTNDGDRIVNTFKTLVLKAYGEKSPDGREFIKSKKLRRRFSQTNAYSDLFMLFATNAEEAALFVQGIMPADLAEEVAKIEKANAANNKPSLTAQYRARATAELPKDISDSDHAKTGTAALVRQGMAGEAPSQVDLENMSREDLLRWAASSRDHMRVGQDAPSE